MAPTVGETYEIEYTVGVVNIAATLFGGLTVDDYGVLFSQQVGTHKHTVTAQTTAELTFYVTGGVGATIDNVSIKRVLDRPKTRIEIWPKPDDNYLMKIEGPMVIGPFVADGDRASFDSRLILLYAVAYGKAHLNRQDAKSAMDAWTLRLSKIKANQHGTREYVRRNPSRPEAVVRSRPKVV